MTNKLKLVCAFLGVLVGWLFVLLPFEVYDEQSHFASIAYLVENGKMPNEKINDLSLEEEKAERYFGVMTDGTNAYAYKQAYHPEWTNTLIGTYENEIRDLNTRENRTAYTIHQAAIYPPLYYVLASVFYKLLYTTDIIGRVFASRSLSLAITIATVLAAYVCAYEINRSRRFATTVATLTLMYPMTTFIGVGINSDNLHNLLFTVFLWLAVKLVRSGLSVQVAAMMGVVVGIDLLTKPQGYIMLPIAALALIIRGFKQEWPQLGRAIIWGSLPILLIAGWQEIPKFVGGNPYIVQSVSDPSVVPNASEFLRNFAHTASSQLVVWYWGVFKWNTVLLPKVWWWISNRLLLMAIIGCGLSLGKDVWQRKLGHQSKMIIFAAAANAIYLAALVYYDWQYVQLKGRSLGFQARYFMPLLSLQMALLVIGLTELGWSQRVKEWVRKAIILFFVGLQLTAIYTVASSYYDVSSLQTFIIQASQYKPAIAKGNWWYLWIAAYFSGIGYLTWTALFVRDEIEVHEETTQSRDSHTGTGRSARR